MPRSVKEYNHNNLAGCVTQRRAKQTGRLVGVYNAEQAGLDSDPDVPWFTICEDHSILVGHPTLALAIAHAADPMGWCGVCNGNDEPID